MTGFMRTGLVLALRRREQHSWIRSNAYAARSVSTKEDVQQ
ncbi:uncharacterized protein RAG0_13156 [Rhynchosporium agropyri]|uniref:Uncharacterized protein n=1 Tax=Rhynchosporium agropyri TaxID=914238 RepID=A0A1E1LBT6_9HELO|nr:uncharacterized protein RAG0_13156 [Rhynchosporium agropyri]